MAGSRPSRAPSRWLRCLALAGLAGLALACAGSACAQFGEASDASPPLRTNGSVSYIVGAQDANAHALLPATELTSGGGIASQRLQTMLRVSQNRRFSALFDAQTEWLAYSSQRRDSQVNQFYLGLDATPTFKLRIGRQRVLWGNGFAFIPTDFVNPPISPTAIDLAKPGVDAVSFDHLGESFSLTGIVARSARIEADGRRTGANGIGLKLTSSAVSGLDLNAVYYWSRPLGHAIGVSAQADTSVAWLPDVPGLVLFGSVALNQKSRYPKLDEAAAAIPLPAPADPRGPYTSFLLGGTYTIDARRMDLTAEFYGIGDAYSRGDYQRVLGALAEPGSPTWQAASPWLDHLSYGRNQRRYLNLALSQRSVTAGEGRFTDTLSYDVGLLVGIGDGSRLVSLGLRSNRWDHAELGLRAYLPGGGSATEFGSMPFRWRVEASVKLAY